jgi:hypothetical protein
MALAIVSGINYVAKAWPVLTGRDAEEPPAT